MKRQLQFWSALLALVLASAGRRDALAQQARLDTVEQGTIRLHFLLRPVGIERYAVTRAAGTLAVQSDVDFTERGTRVRLTGALAMRADLTPEHLTVTGNSYRVFFVDTHVDVRNGVATVRAIGDSSTVPLAGSYFTVDGYAPLAIQMMLVRYWESHGRPTSLRAVPGDPTNAVMVARRGDDTILVSGARVALTRYSVDGVIWGRESLWLNSAGQLAAVTTSAGGLPFEGIREEYAAALPALMARANADRMSDLARLMREVRPVASGDVGTLALVGATLVDGRGGTPIANATVVVSAGKIAAAGARATVKIPPGARTIDVAGKTIIPGLWDTHAHASQVEWGPAYLAAGVTTIRDMGGEFDFLRAFRDAVASGRGLGPRMLLAGLVDGASMSSFGVDTAATPEQARSEVRRYHDAGFQQIKVYTYVKPAIVGELSRAAHEAGMTVVGHVPSGMTARSVVDSGMDQIAHMAIRVDTMTSDGRDALAFFVHHQTLVDPTLSWGELLGHSSREAVSAIHPGVPSLPFALRSLILSIHAPDTDTAVTHQRVRQQGAAVYALYKAGLPVVAGTDKGVPALSLARELEIYVAGGFSPMEALQTATAVPARVMRDAEAGTIEAGKRADLVVLNANPMDAISNVRAVHRVMTGGRLYDPADLWRSVGFHVPPAKKH
ncbi:MAG: amidohydrolase family protein [bacterium]